MSTSQGQAGQGQPGQRQFGVGNLEYDLFATVTHLLEAEETFMRYAQDADQAGDQGCAQLFRSLQQQHRQTARQARERLIQHLTGQHGGQTGTSA